MTKVTPVQLQKNLTGVVYPASKQDIIKKAEEEGADEQILKVLEQLPNQQYETSTAVSQVLAEIK